MKIRFDGEPAKGWECERAGKAPARRLVQQPSPDNPSLDKTGVPTEMEKILKDTAAN